MATVGARFFFFLFLLFLLFLLFNFFFVLVLVLVFVLFLRLVSVNALPSFAACQPRHSGASAGAAADVNPPPSTFATRLTYCKSLSV